MNKLEFCLEWVLLSGAGHKDLHPSGGAFYGEVIPGSRRERQQGDREGDTISG